MMLMRTTFGVAILGLGLGLMDATPASALSMKDCSVKYKAAQSAGTLNGEKWNDFRKSECGAEATAQPASATAPAAAAPAAATANPLKPAPSVASAAPAAPVAIGNAVFPSAVSPKYASEAAGKARMHTCDDQYKVNKTNNGNGGLKWIQKGGGYWSECNKHLKGA